jgi:hypothetical protein
MIHLYIENESSENVYTPPPTTATLYFISSCDIDDGTERNCWPWNAEKAVAVLKTSERVAMVYFMLDEEEPKLEQKCGMLKVALMDARPRKTMEEKKEDTTPYLSQVDLFGCTLVRMENTRLRSDQCRLNFEIGSAGHLIASC